MSEKITILNEDIPENDFPVLYKWAKTNPKGLEVALKAIAEKNKESIATSMINLESDLQTDSD